MTQESITANKSYFRQLNEGRLDDALIVNIHNLAYSPADHRTPAAGPSDATGTPSGAVASDTSQGESVAAISVDIDFA